MEWRQQKKYLMKLISLKLRLRSLKNQLAGTLGTIVEWYDFALYGFFSPIFAVLFFPSDAFYFALLKTWGIFAVGFITRPLGGLFFGMLADKYGRTACLKVTPLLITIPTCFIALLPSAAIIHGWAPFLLTLLRIIQGLCIGGEFAISIVYLCEDNKNKYFWGSIGSCTGSLGIFLASLVAVIFYTVFSHHFVYTIGWRIAFLFSFIAGILVYCFRRNMEESEAYQDLVPIKNPFVSLVKQKRDYLVAIGLTYLSATAFYFVFMFMPNYLQMISPKQAVESLSQNTISLFFRLFIIPVLGIVAGKIGGIKFTRLSCLIFIVVSLPLFLLFINNTNYRFLAFYLFAFLTTLNAASLPGLLVEILPIETRCTVLAFSFNFAFGVLGGIVPFLCFSLLKKSIILPVLYLVFSAGMTLIASFFIKPVKI
jgi:MHS family proline/betaine transporter-like MFS transporter